MLRMVDLMLTQVQELEILGMAQAQVVRAGAGIGFGPGSGFGGNGPARWIYYNKYNVREQGVSIPDNP